MEIIVIVNTHQKHSRITQLIFQNWVSTESEKTLRDTDSLPSVYKKSMLDKPHLEQLHQDPKYQ